MCDTELPHAQPPHKFTTAFLTEFSPCSLRPVWSVLSLRFNLYRADPCKSAAAFVIPHSATPAFRCMLPCNYFFLVNAPFLSAGGLVISDTPQRIGDYEIIRELGSRRHGQ